MQVGAVLIDELVLDPGAGVPVARPVLYTFGEFHLVSARRAGATDQLGPIGVLEGNGEVAATSFPERPLAWSNEMRRFWYSEPWTTPPWTLYVLIPPPGFIEDLLMVRDERGEVMAGMTLASFDGRLFHFMLLGSAKDQHAFEVEAGFERDAQRLAEALSRLERGPAERRWSAVRDSVAGPLRASGAAIATAAAVKTLFGL